MNLSVLSEIFQQRRKSIVALLLLLTAASGLQLFVSAYQQPRAAGLAGEWLKQRELEGRVAALQNRDTLFRNGQADLAKFRARIYPKNQFARFVGEIYDIAGRNSLDIISITYKPTFNKDEQLLEYALTLSVSGKYQQLKKFIHDLGIGSNILTIDSVALTSSGLTSDTVQLQVMITSYFRMEEQ